MLVKGATGDQGWSMGYIDGIAQDCGNSIALAMELL